MDKPTIRQDNDDSDVDEIESDMECATCGSEHPNCICYAKGKRPVWIKID